jgi:NAD(P)-dependent dehydrogenase (short-subunit alcohol dehydrogenase family)
MTDKQWHTIVDLHATAPFKIVRAAAPYFRVKDGEPRNIINISSTSGVNGNAGQINYALAKAGVTGMTKTIAKEYVHEPVSSHRNTNVFVGGVPNSACARIPLLSDTSRRG